MKKSGDITWAPILIIIVILSVAGLGGYMLIQAGDAPTSTNTSSDNASDTNVKAAQNMNVAATAGQYVDYSDSVITSTTGQKILFFHAPWCPQCRKLEQSIISGVIPPSVTIIKVDYDSNQALRQQYGVTLQTTVVLVDDAGRFVKKFNAYDDPSLSRVVQELL